MDAKAATARRDATVAAPDAAAERGERLACPERGGGRLHPPSV